VTFPADLPPQSDEEDPSANYLNVSPFPTEG